MSCLIYIHILIKFYKCLCLFFQIKIFNSHSKKRKLGSDSDLTSEEARKIKEKFRTDIAGVIVQHLTPYRRDSCQTGRISGDEDFKHLARKV